MYDVFTNDSCPDCAMGKVKIVIYCHFIADILIKVFQKCLWSCPLQNILKNQLLRSYIVGKAETVEKCSSHEPLQNNVFFLAAACQYTLGTMAN